MEENIDSGVCFVAQFDNYPREVGRVEVVIAKNYDLQLLIGIGSHEELLLESYRDQWGVFYNILGLTIAQEDQTRSFLDALIKSLNYIRHHSEYCTTEASCNVVKELFEDSKNTGTDMQKFELTAEHVKLLRHANVCFDPNCEWGSVGLNCKRPFGDSDLITSMAKILEVTPVETDDEEVHWPKNTSSRMKKLYEEELPTALSVILSSGSFEPGIYETERYTTKWRRVYSN